ncbi:lysozyme inhibitor LprI family protein [Sphingomonas sp.]|uniref:lysozyme inhibitor LprI family protein n=1 Tax=Sphingomonas sp. TaxID=28214 RepID=UPI0028A9DEDF|nr:lysozyme inhibitor LprI family protein [Sphingomonas sp.]
MAPAAAAGAREDATDAALRRCLAALANASTAGQTNCEVAAERAYDRRMNAAYATLLRRLPAAAGVQLRRSQRAWIAYRDVEEQARQTIYATRQGTMYVPMQSDDLTTLIGDRARMLERYVRVMVIE